MTFKPHVDRRPIAEAAGITANERLDLFRLPKEVVDLPGGDSLEILVFRIHRPTRRDQLEILGVQSVRSGQIRLDQRAKSPTLQSGEIVGVHAVAGRNSFRIQFSWPVYRTSQRATRRRMIATVLAISDSP